MSTNKIFIDMAQRAHEFAEMCERMTNETKQKEDPEAWREEYLKRQAAGVKFQRKSCGEWLHPINMFDFSGKKEDYREVPQEVSGAEYARAEPHAAERALWKAQRDAGTNEVWQGHPDLIGGHEEHWYDYDINEEPEWVPDFRYRVKPMKLTAKIVRRGVYKTSYYWQFTGTREEYRAECEKYGYAIVSEITEVVEKPKTVKYYLCLLKSADCETPCSYANLSKERMIEFAAQQKYTIIGDIETREVEV